VSNTGENRRASSEAGQLLRHRRPETTAGYAKVHASALRAVARPWPGGMPCRPPATRVTVSIAALRALARPWPGSMP
jgi:hypothetical protein